MYQLNDYLNFSCFRFEHFLEASPFERFAEIPVPQLQNLDGREVKRIRVYVDLNEIVSILAQLDQAFAGKEGSKAESIGAESV